MYICCISCPGAVQKIGARAASQYIASGAIILQFCLRFKHLSHNRGRGALHSWRCRTSRRNWSQSCESAGVHTCQNFVQCVVCDRFYAACLFSLVDHPSSACFSRTRTVRVSLLCVENLVTCANHGAALRRQMIDLGFVNCDLLRTSLDACLAIFLYAQCFV